MEIKKIQAVEFKSFSSYCDLTNVFYVLYHALTIYMILKILNQTFIHLY